MKIKFLCNLVLFLALFPMFVFSSKGIATLEDLFSAIDRLPTNRSLLKEFDESMVSDEAKRYEYRGISDAEELESEIESWMKMRSAKMNDQNLWKASNNDQIMPEKSFFDFFKTISFTPFVEKIISKKNERFLMRGDLHGDIHSLVAQLKDMKSKGLIDDNFKLKKGINMLFLGDFVDRGCFGLEVIFVIARLGNANPDNVFYTRGNHEDIDVCSDYGFKDEVLAKFGSQKLYEKICRMYDFMPTAIYLGDLLGESFVQLCHGGIEHGYKPNSLLDSNNRFQLIGKLHRKRNMNDLLRLSKISKELKSNILSLQEFMEDDLIPESPTTSFLYFGHMWNDFDPFAINSALFKLKPGRGLEYGQEIADLIFAQHSGKKAKIIGIIRAHQHSSSPYDQMMKNLMRYKGCWNMRGCDSQAGIGADPEHKDVLTLNVAPDTVYGENVCFDYDTVIEVTPNISGVWNITKHIYYPLAGKQ